MNTYKSLTLPQAAKQKNTTVQTIRMAAKRGAIHWTVTNQDAPPARWERRVITYTIAQIAAGAHPTYNGGAFPCSEATVRRAIRAGAFRANLLNPEAAPYRWEWRIPDTEPLRRWKPRKYQRRESPR